MNRSVLGVFALLAAAMAVPALATPIITVGDHDLLPNRAGQQVQVFVSGGDPVQGVNLFIQLADGGQFAGGTATGPVITAVDILTGTIFASNHTGARGGPDGPLFWERSTVTSTGTVTAQGLLATITIDTTGYLSGTFPLSFKPTLAQSDFADPEIDVVIDDGLLTIVNGWRNPMNPLDVNADTLVNALDVLQVVNELNAHGTRELEQIIAPAGPPPYYDVSGDTLISALDVVQVVNFINANPQVSLQSLASPSTMALAMASVPEPSTWALAATTVVALSLAFRRRRD